MSERYRYLDRLRWIEVKNASVGTAIPAWGLVRVTGEDTDADSTPTVDAPNAASQARLMVVGPTGIPAGGTGLATYDEPVPVAYLAADGTPAIGEEWGAESGGYKLRKAKSGYRIFGTPGTGVVEAVRVGVRAAVKGKLDGALALNGSATLSVWERVSGTETDTGENLTVYDWGFLKSGSLKAGAEIEAYYDVKSDRWYLSWAVVRTAAKGKLDGTLTFGGSATMSVWEAADTGEDLTVYDWLLSSGQTVASGVQVSVAWDANHGRWDVVGAQCVS